MTLPLGLRNRLAELVLEAFDEEAARRTLDALQAFCWSADGRATAAVAARLMDLGWFEVEPSGGARLARAHRTHRDALCRRVTAAVGVFRAGGTPPERGTRFGLLERAARLAEAGLFFEVHELLEPAWMRAEGAERAALQGLIQVAVAFHHVENGNREGGVSLLTEGLAKLAGSASALPLDFGAWLTGLHGVLAALREARPLPPRPRWPHPAASPPREAAWPSS